MKFESLKNPYVSVTKLPRKLEILLYSPYYVNYNLAIEKLEEDPNFQV